MVTILSNKGHPPCLCPIFPPFYISRKSFVGQRMIFNVSVRLSPTDKKKKEKKIVTFNEKKIVTFNAPLERAF